MKKITVINICFFAPQNPSNFFASLLSLKNECNKNGFINTLFVFPQVAKERKWTYQIEQELVYYSEFKFWTIWKTIKKIKKETKGLLIFHTHFVGPRVIMAIKLAALGRKYKIIFHMHNHVNISTNSIKSYVRQVLYKNVEFIGVSNAVVDDLRATYPKEKSLLVRNGISFQFLESSKLMERNNFVEPQKFNIMIMGNDFHGKGVDLVVEAVKNLQDKKCFLYIVSNYEEHIKENLIHFFPEESLEYIKVIKSVDFVKDLYDQMDLFISASRRDAFCYSVVEAAYSKCQVAASDIPGQNTMKILPHILWFQAENVNEIINQIEVAINRSQDEELLQRFKEEQRRIALREFLIENWSKSIIEIYYRYQRKPDEN